MVERGLALGPEADEACRECVKNLEGEIGARSTRMGSTMKHPSSSRRSAKARAAGGLRRFAHPSGSPEAKSGSQTAHELHGADALSVLEALAGSIEAPADWAAEHDHYLYGAPKRGASLA